MKQKLRRFYKAVRRELTENKGTFFLYVALRFMVVGILVLQYFNKNYENVLLCILTLILMIMPSVVQATFKVEFPSTLEIIILVFIFAAEIMGEISSFYVKFQYWDTVLHTLNGFLCAVVGFSLVDVMNRQKRLKFEMSPMFMAITSFCFSMTIGILWEFLEFGCDYLFGFDMQKDTVIHSISSVYLDPLNDNNRVVISNISEVMIDGNNLDIGGYLDIGLFDTMEDLMVNFIGALTFSVIGYFYIKRRDSKKLVESLMLEPWSEDKKEIIIEE